MPFLTIIVPVYNKVKYLDESIESILNQSFTDFELFLVDDGSTDGSGERCDYFGSSDSRITVIHQKNKGVSSARNEGLKISNGKYIGFVDSDDILEKDMYEILVRNAINTDSDISVCSIKKIYRNKVKKALYENNYKVYDGDEGLSAALTGWFDMSVNNKIFKSEISKNIKFEGRFKEDFLYNIAAFSVAGRSVFQNTAKYIYVLRDNSVSIKKFSERDMEGISVDKKIITIVADRNEIILEEAQINYFVQNLATMNLILLSSRKKNLADFETISENLKKYSFLAKKSSLLRIKHKLAYFIFRLSPGLYKVMLQLYVLVIPSEVGIRDK
jgi:glycosyltransferase involved in cell wall biosynthesis